MLPPRSAEPQFWPIFGLFCEVLGSTRYPLAQSRGLVFSCFFQLMFYMFFSWDFLCGLCQFSLAGCLLNTLERASFREDLKKF